MQTKDEGFETMIDGRRYWIEAGHEDKSQELYAQAFDPSDLYKYINNAFSDISTEDAILKLVKLIEK